MARDLRDPLRPKEFALGLNDEIVILSLAISAAVSKSTPLYPYCLLNG
jgi:hypothetical protein